MSDFDAKFAEVLQQGHGLDYAKDRLPIWTEAFNLALAAHRLDEAMLARYYYVLDATPFDPDGAVVAFVWCTGHLEHDRLVHPSRIVRLYGTITRLLYEDPKYPMDQLERTWDQMAARFQEFGFERTRYVYHRLYKEIAVADDDAVRETFDELESLELRDKRICRWATTQDVHVYFEEHEQALEYGFRVLNSGEDCVHNHPTVVRFENLVPLLELDRLDEAKVQFATAERKIDDKHNNRMWCAARAIYYLAATGGLERGEYYFTDCYKLVRDGGSPADHHRFFTASRSYLRRCIEDGYNCDHMMDVVGFDGTVDELLDTITTETRDIADAFDKRHGNRWYNDMIDQYDALYDRIKKVAG